MPDWTVKPNTNPIPDSIVLTKPFSNASGSLVGGGGGVVFNVGGATAFSGNSQNLVFAAGQQQNIPLFAASYKGGQAVGFFQLTGVIPTAVPGLQNVVAVGNITVTIFWQTNMSKNYVINYSGLDDNFLKIFEDASAADVNFGVNATLTNNLGWYSAANGTTTPAPATIGEIFLLMMEF